jgi:hypothetical protein
MDVDVVSDFRLQAFASRTAAERVEREGSARELVSPLFLEISRNAAPHPFSAAC